MPVTVTMPALSPTMEEGKLAVWLVAEGDRIEVGDVIAEIETDKATMEFEAPENGVLVQVMVPAGTEGVAVGAPVALLAGDGEYLATLAGLGSADAPEAVNDGASSPPEPETAAPPAAASPLSIQAGDARVFASPLARRIACDVGLDIGSVVGSGPHGRIVRVDVEAAVARKPSGATAAAAASVADLSHLYPESSYEVVELDGMRKTIARRLTDAKQTVPHFYLRTDVELDALLAFRAQLNAAAPLDVEGTAAYRISVNDMVIKALAYALHDVPDANVTWAGDAVRRHKVVDVAVAVSIDGGLITPIVHDAGAKSLSAISAQMKDLATRARHRKLSPEEYQGGTTSVSNLGMFGVSSFDAVINPPHGTILAVGAGEKRAVVRGDEIAVATVMTVSLSVDHRSVDGALGAELLSAFKRYVENPPALVA